MASECLHARFTINISYLELKKVIFCYIMLNIDIESLFVDMTYERRREGRVLSSFYFTQWSNFRYFSIYARRDAKLLAFRITLSCNVPCQAAMYEPPLFYRFFDYQLWVYVFLTFHILHWLYLVPFCNR